MGKAGSSLQLRIKQQLNNVRLMQHVRSAKIGERILLLGRFVPQQGQQPDNCVPIIERAFIRHYLEQGHDLANVHGAEIKIHEILSEGAGVRQYAIPTKLVVDQ
ncbi:MAG: hypothetical protein F9K29_01495 [Hyphomicrobiaceae bacterium]|nr:MAG: hypothetical protein F9K29_01495 [Hyphomicrobiaceae bacterium]